MIHDVDSVWKEEATSQGIQVGRGIGATIIIDDILNWAKYFQLALQYISCQLRICKAYRLTLSLKKSHFFPKRVEFVGIDISPDGNRPAMSKHELPNHWPIPELVRDVPVLSGSSNFIVNSSQTSKSESSPFDRLWNGNIRKWLGTFGRLTFKQLSMTYGNQYCAIHVCAGFTLTNSRFFGRTFRQKVLVTLYVSWTTTTHPLPSLCSLCLATDFTFLRKLMAAFFTPSRLGPAVPVVTNNTSTRIMVKASQTIGR